MTEPLTPWVALTHDCLPCRSITVRTGSFARVIASNSKTVILEVPGVTVTLEMDRDKVVRLRGEERIIHLMAEFDGGRHQGMRSAMDSLGWAFDTNWHQDTIQALYEAAKEASKGAVNDRCIVGHFRDAILALQATGEYPDYKVPEFPTSFVPGSVMGG